MMSLTSRLRPPVSLLPALARHYNINAQERMCSLVNKTKVVSRVLVYEVLLSTAQVVVFMRGTERRPSPGCAASQEVAATLGRAGVLWEAVDVSRDTQAELAIRCSDSI